MKSRNPLHKFGVAAFHDRVGHDSKILPARKRGATIATCFFGCVMLFAFAMRADWAVWPAGGFKPPPSGVFIVEVGFCKLVLSHWGLPLWPNTSLCGLWRQLHNTPFGCTHPKTRWGAAAHRVRRLLTERARIGGPRAKSARDHVG